MVDVTALSNYELRDNLIELGFQPGPIIESTRRVYELKYLQMIGEVNSSDSGEDEDLASAQPTRLTSPVKRTNVRKPSPEPAAASSSFNSDSEQRELTPAEQNAKWKVRVAVVLALAILMYFYFGSGPN